MIYIGKYRKHIALIQAEMSSASYNLVMEKHYETFNDWFKLEVSNHLK